MTTSQFSVVAPIWQGQTVVCVGTGSSLTRDRVEFCRGRARMIVVNDAFKLAPWADCMYAADDKYWRWENGAPDFTGMKYTIEPCRKEWPGLRVLKNKGLTGLSLDPSGLCTGSTSGYQAIGLAVHLGAARIVLLGYDMHGKHFFGSHKDGSVPPFTLSLAAFPTLVEPLRTIGVEVINCTPKSAIKTFPSADLHDVLCEVAA